MVDTLAIGGAERVAVNLVNTLPRDQFEPFLCTTRQDGPLAKSIAPDVVTLSLQRRSRYDVKAIFRLARFVRQHQIDILHAHSTSLFIAVVASLLTGFPKVIWHEHSGKHLLSKRPFWPYFLASKRCDWIVTVNQDISDWVIHQLNYHVYRITYVPNFVVPNPKLKANNDLPGCRSLRLVCLANLTRPKDHDTLLEAMAKVVNFVPDVHLLLIGKTDDEDYYRYLQEKSRDLRLESILTWMGQREDAYDILLECSIGILSSRTEGLPLVLLEYGLAGLATVATSVGQCPEVLDQGEAGLLVTPGSPQELAEAIIALLNNVDRRRELGAKLQQRIKTYYSVQAVLPKMQEIYKNVMLLA